MKKPEFILRPSPPVLSEVASPWNATTLHAQNERMMGT